MSAISLHHYIQIEDSPAFEKVQPPSIPTDLIIKIIQDENLFCLYLNREVSKEFSQSYKEKKDRLQDHINNNKIFQILFPEYISCELKLACKKVVQLSRRVFKHTGFSTNYLNKPSDWIISPDRFTYQINLLAQEIIFAKKAVSTFDVLFKPGLASFGYLIMMIYTTKNFTSGIANHSIALSLDQTLLAYTTHYLYKNKEAIKRSLNFRSIKKTLNYNFKEIQKCLKQNLELPMPALPPPLS